MTSMENSHFGESRRMRPVPMNCSVLSRGDGSDRLLSRRPSFREPPGQNIAMSKSEAAMMAMLPDVVKCRNLIFDALDGYDYKHHRFTMPVFLLGEYIV